MTVKAASYSNDEQKQTEYDWAFFTSKKKIPFWCFLCIFTPCRCKVLESRWVSEPNWRRSKFLYRVWNLFFLFLLHLLCFQTSGRIPKHKVYSMFYICVLFHISFLFYICFTLLLLMVMCLSLIQLLMAMTRTQAVRCTRFIMTAFFYSLLEIRPFFFRHLAENKAMVNKWGQTSGPRTTTGRRN